MRGAADGYWSRRANDRRNLRQAKVEIRPPSGSSKDTKRWCRGVVGREHQPQCVDWAKHTRSTLKVEWRVLVCTACKKQLAYYFPSPFRKTPVPPPSWVTF